jgi:aspartate kinase
MEKVMSDGKRQSRFERGNDVVVVKFGGTSVQDEAAIRRLIAIVRSKRGVQPVVVVSALAKVTDQLLDAGKAASSGHLGAALAAARDIYVRHEHLADQLLSHSAYGALDRELRGCFRALEMLLLELEAAGELSRRQQDQLLGFGECFSSQLIKSALCEDGMKASHVDARTCIVTDGKHGQASPVWDVTNDRLRQTLTPLLEAGRVPVLGGFIASSQEGAPTTLGRGGSDFTASIVGAALGASRVEIWTDVDGVMTTDPKLCAEARVIRKMSFDEAAELAHFGAKVLHPATLAPAIRENIPVRVLNARKPEGEGTEIVLRAHSGKRVSAITAKRNVAAVDISLTRSIDTELLGEVFAAFDQHHCPVDVMATGLRRMCFLVGSTASLPAIAAQLKGIAELKWENHKALICLVGEDIRRQPDVASRVFAAVSDMDVRVLCQSASDRTISFLVEESRVQEAVERLHRHFFPKPEPARDWGGISTAYCQAG